MLVVFSLAYLAAFSLYQGNLQRCALPWANNALVLGLRVTGYTLLLIVTVVSVMSWGGERGIPTALAALSLAAPLSLLLASRWPQMHTFSAPAATLLAMAGLLL